MQPMPSSLLGRLGVSQARLLKWSGTDRSERQFAPLHSFSWQYIPALGLKTCLRQIFTFRRHAGTYQLTRPLSPYWSWASFWVY